MCIWEQSTHFRFSHYTFSQHGCIWAGVAWTVGVINSLAILIITIAVTNSVPETSWLAPFWFAMYLYLLQGMCAFVKHSTKKKEKCLPVANWEMLTELISTGLFQQALSIVQMENKGENKLECL